jgi:hypothetical protein
LAQALVPDIQWCIKERDKVVATLREMRVKWELAEASGKKSPAAPKVTSNAALSLLTSKKPGDLGL